MEDVIVPLAIFMIPVVAIIGGLTAAIARMIGQQRLMELAQRERIAAIERGVDVDKLPPLPSFVGGADGLGTMYLSPRDAAMRRSQGLVVGGLVTLAAGVGLGLMLYIIPDARQAHAWAVGLIPGLIGAALLVRRDGSAPNGGGTPPRA